MDNVRVSRLITGEIVVFQNLPAKEGRVKMLSPHALIQMQQGTGLAPMMPWAQKGKDFELEMSEEKIMFDYPIEQCEALISSYTQATSSLDLSALGNVSQFVKPN